MPPAADPLARRAPAAPSPFLRIPPFPGSQVQRFDPLPGALDHESRPSLTQCLSLLRDHKVGGYYWGPQPELPSEYFLVRSGSVLPLCGELEKQHGAALLWPSCPGERRPVQSVPSDGDPWHLLSRARALVCDPTDEVRLIAALLGVPTYLADPADGPPSLSAGDAASIAAEVLDPSASFSSPFGGGAMTHAQVIELCGFWRALVDSNRDLAKGVGFAFWKQDSVLPLLWGGGDSSAFFHKPSRSDQGAPIAIWRSKTAPDLIHRLERQQAKLVEVEDGFLRSNGLGADCVPPLSITVDRLGPYFDPGQPSELEQLLQHGSFGSPLLERARRLRETIVAAGLGKYEQGAAPMDRVDPDRRHILVPGQVEDDRSVLAGGSGLVSNLELLKRIRAREPDACLLYKPHPDVIAGHRKGDIPAETCLRFADQIVADAPISSLLAMVDEVHVNTSLAGFEGLMRGKKVTTHGVPFYAGWGLTEDLGPVPARRSVKRSLDELVAATLLVYPRYLDPVTGLPCPAEVVVDRLLAPAEAGPLVRLRRLQGRWKRRLATWLAA